MGIVASFKNPLEIECVVPPVFDCTGGADEANNEGQAGSYQATAGQYRGASKKEKGEILEQSIATTGYHIQRIAFIPFCLNTDNVIVPFDRRL
jgi:hypothetical protein